MVGEWAGLAMAELVLAGAGVAGIGEADGEKIGCGRVVGRR
jgi:hypothetical protein